MGTDLILKKGDEFVADLGRAYHYDGGFDIESVTEHRNELIINMKSDIISKIAYAPKDFEDLRRVVEDAEDSIQYYVDALINIGERTLLAKILGNENMTTIEE
jgi:hypothetical protein